MRLHWMPRRLERLTAASMLRMNNLLDEAVASMSGILPQTMGFM